MSNAKSGRHTRKLLATNGWLTKKVLPNGLETVYEYNDANWVTKIILDAPYRCDGEGWRRRERILGR